MTHLPLVHLLGPESFPDGANASDLAVLRNTTLHLEESGFAALVFPNTNGPRAIRHGHPFLPCEPFTACGFLAASTRFIGLAVAVQAATSEPYNVARRLASLDHISRGRIGWNLTESVEELAEQYGDHSRPPRPVSAARAIEFTNVVQALWDSWSNEAITVRPDGSSAIDGSKNRPIFHEGPFYKVKGPLDVPRPPQGHPVLFQTVEPSQDLTLAARFSDVVMPAVSSREELEAFRQAFQAEALRNGRPGDRVKIMPRLSSSWKKDKRETVHHMVNWFRTGLADGFCITGPLIDRFADEVTPHLREQGLSDSPPERLFLSERLGLPLHLRSERM